MEMSGRRKEYWNMVAVGPTDISKTTSLAGMYGEINIFRRIPFDYEGSKLAFKPNVKLDRWARMLDAGRQLDPTVSKQVFDMTLQYSGNDLTRIHWTDTVGGSISPGNSHHADTVREVSKADIVFVFLSCSEFMPSSKENVDRYMQQVLDTLNLLRYAPHGCTVVFCLCKCDLVSSTVKRRAENTLCHALDGFGLRSRGAFTTNAHSDIYRMPAVPVLTMVQECVDYELNVTSRLRFIKRGNYRKASRDIESWLSATGNEYGGVWEW